MLPEGSRNRAREGAATIRKHIIPVTTRTFDDFAAAARTAPPIAVFLASPGTADMT